MSDKKKTAEENQTEEQSSSENSVIEELKSQVNEAKEKHLKVLADFENFKKRVQKEKEEFNLFANASILNILLEVMDDLSRGLEQMEDVPVGLSMIGDKVKSFMEQQNVEEVEINKGDKFDPKKMEAIGTVAVQSEEEDNTVIHLERKGYKIKDKDGMIRSARAIIGKYDKK